MAAPPGVIAIIITSIHHHRHVSQQNSAANADAFVHLCICAFVHVCICQFVHLCSETAQNEKNDMYHIGYIALLYTMDVQ